MTPESKTASAVKCVTLTTSYDNPNTKTLYYMATSQNFPNEEMHLALIKTSDRRLAEGSPHDKLWGIGPSACDPESANALTVKRATLATTSCKNIANISSREATLRHSHKKMKYALPLDVLANATSPKLAPMINCGAPA